MTHPLFFRSVVTALGFLFTASVFAEAGRVTDSSGTITVERKSKTLALNKDAEIQSGDVLVTGDKSTVAVRMVNGEEIYLRPNTRFSVDQFRAPKNAKNPGSGRSFYSLLKGGFRAVTKSLGKRGLDSYRITTPVATIGVRGSIIIGALGSAGELGFGVEEGLGYVVNSAGSVDVTAGTYASVASATTAPAASTAMPSALSQAGFQPLGAAAGTTSAAGSAVGTIAGVSTTTLAIGAAALAGVIAITAGDDDSTTTTTTTTTTKPH